MPEQLTISISPSGGFRLLWPDSHFCDFPLSEKGCELLHQVVFNWQLEQARIGTEAKPTQSMVEAWLVALSEGGKQLAGDTLRWQEVKKATGVKVRRLDAKGYEKDVSLEDLGL